MNSLRVFIILGVQNQSSFTIYNASAGSGKTHTLVKEYLKVLFRSNNLLRFRSVLALTFTNKAVGEMKERIIESLKAFSEPSILERSNSMFEELCQELEIQPESLHEKSKHLLHIIVHNYAAFDISTIDKFNHKIIRTFAHDLNIPVNFEVELDTASILAKAVDQLIENAGSDPELTKLLVDFAIEKTNEDKSWDVSVDLNTISKLLIQENDLNFIDGLKNKSLQDFKTLRLKLKKQFDLISAQIRELSDSILELIERNGIDHKDFSGSYLPKFFVKLSTGNLYPEFEKVWQQNLLEGGPICPKKTNDQNRNAIEAIRPQLIEAFEETQKAVYQLKFIKTALNNMVPLSVLTSIKQVLETLKTEDEFLLISEFNAIIQKELSEQPTPFIYERIGEKFKHYFIDEFQDTSKLQWGNLIPLIANTISGETLSGETGSAMLVGDAKQAIYRWRGGYAEQFIELYTKQNKPFFTEQTIIELPKNYRSSKTIVEFNNLLFDHISEMNDVFTNPDHASMYKKSTQESVNNIEGLVELSFLDPDEEEDETLLQCEAVLEKIESAIQDEFSFSDICVIVRRKKEGIAISEFLKAQEIPILSSETLLLKNSPEVNFIISLLTLIVQPNNEEVKVEVLEYLGIYKLELKDLHSFFSEMMPLSLFKLFDRLKAYHFDFDLNTFFQLPVYESIEAIVRDFKLNVSANAYLQFFLDEVFDFSQRSNSGITSFLELWDRKKDSISVSSPEGDNAIQIMTIHKSKGLEFPVVIFPFANQDLYHDLNPKIWFPVDQGQFNGFSHLYINFNKDLQYYNETGQLLYNNYRSAQELDSINLLYVVLTRAVERLHVISKFDLDINGNEKRHLISGLLINYLKTKGLWTDGLLTYTFGQQKVRAQKETAQNPITYQKQLISTAKENHDLQLITNSGYLWDTTQEQAIEKGKLVHDIMANIETENDIDFALDSFYMEGVINLQQLQELRPLIQNIVDHPSLNSYFKPGLDIYNERDILSKSGKIVRPDRLVLTEPGSVIIIDYKTGQPSSKHEEQLYDYQAVLEEMSYTITKKILVYLNEEIVIKEF